jgi:branched-subunit amino acid aminotransferase/4-amino-4-deoxychorismate lyase
MFGLGVFETLRVSNSQPELWQKHWVRLTRSAAALGLDYQQTSHALLTRSRDLLAIENASESVLKIVVFADISGVGELISLRPIPYSRAQFEQGFSLKSVRGRGTASHLSHLKTQNYLGNLQALRQARAEGFDEVVFTDEQGNFLEGATTNFFLVRDETIYTAPLAAGVLPGIVREAIFELPGRSVVEKELNVNDLNAASEAFVTNSVLRIMPVRRVGNRAFCAPYKTTELISKELVMIT